MLDVLVLDRDAEVYSEAIGKALPGVRAFAATNERAALGGCAEAEVAVALAHVISDRLVAAMPRLRFIQALTTGIDHLTTLALPPGVAIASMRGIHGPQMSELAFLYMIALYRDFSGMQANQRLKRWERWPQRLLLDKTAVLVGVGAISEELASRAKAFGMRVIGVSDSRASVPGFDELTPRRELRAAAARADFLIVLAPLTPTTRRMIDAAVIAAMKPGAVLVNLARGPVVDEAALIAALRSGHLGGAGLDVFESEPLPADSALWDLPNVIVTPRIGGMSEVYAQQALPLVLENLAAWKTSGARALRNRVDLSGVTHR
jgi:D-2-hydroxyacid dehydrogenase (NADP+)